MQRGGYTCGSEIDLAENVHPNFVRMGSRIKVRDGVILYGSQQTPLTLGDDVYINARSLLHGGSAALTIGSRVSLGCGVIIHTDSGPNTSPLLQSLYPMTPGAVMIEDDVWIGTYAFIMPGVRIGHGSVIGAHALVKKDVPPHTVMAGSPAKAVKILQDHKTACHACSLSRS